MSPIGPPRWRRPIRIALELAIGFALLAGADRWLTGGSGFAGVQPNPYWIPVLVMALAYGTGPGVIAAGIAAALWLAHVHDGSGERDYLDHLFHLSLPPLLWFVAAVAVGEVTTIRLARHARLDRRGRIAMRNVARMTEAFDSLSRTNRRLQVRIATDGATIGHVVDVAARLAAPDAAVRRTAMIALVAIAARTDDFTCYRIAGSEARAWLRSDQATARRDALPVALIDRLVRRRGLVHVARRADRPALEGIGVVAVPLADAATGALAGCLVLHSMPFAALDAGRVADLGEIAGWLTPLLADPGIAAPRAVGPAGMVA
ncbi:hypothetical protein LPN01_10700 [Sphingomonas sp. A2-49]|uniref:hypothetical protein n=1 Tax=Sphingomonas sp. A2-49 TaxID=1391375 RepID=UPI0021D399AC|nr:hypothetical protein [Sphingomonas sp. A2-49]MCU6454545.1 hypothetical protein [Sphingomonas sp. A2-49]